MRNPDIFNGKNVTVFGLHRSGVAVTKLLVALGATVTVTDSRDSADLSAEIERLEQISHQRTVTLYLGGHPEACNSRGSTDCCVARCTVGYSDSLPGAFTRDSDSRRIGVRRECVSCPHRRDYWNKGEVNNNAFDSGDSRSGQAV